MRYVTVYHPELDTTAVVPESAFFVKGGLQAAGWQLVDQVPSAPTDTTSPSDRNDDLTDQEE